FSEEQQKALSNLLLEESGIRILRGRAGAGKSYVLKEFANIVTSNNVHVIGLAPTHKAKMELASEGFECVDTVKGMLFKLANGRFNLPKHSVLVLDEAGMVGNNDYKELLRVAATRQCNVILSMDEKQLTSVQRGGMGEVFADRYGSSTILDIKRQDSNWGRSVAMSMSNGCVETGISILEQENRVKWSSDAESSMQSLLSDWNKSDYAIGDRVILAVRNKDVVALNHGVREYLKMNGKLTGEEIAVGGNHYMKGDRILITKTNKELGVINGDIAEIRAVSKDEFTIRFVSDNNENNKEISFNPSEYHGFRHGYATTIFKAQGASIRDVYLLHNGFAGIRNSYVGLSRHISELNLYINKEATSSIKMLIKQLSHDAEAGSSLAYLTKEELESRALGQRLANNNSRFVRGVNSLLDFVGNTATKIADKYLPSAEYYNYREPKQKVASVELVIDKVYQEMEQKNQAINLESEKLIVGGYSIKATTTFKDNINQNIITAGVINGANTDNERVANSKVIQSINDIGAVKTRQSSKSRFYAHADYVRSKRQYDDQKEEWNKEYVQLQSEIRFKAESIAKDLLGLPNKQLSNGRELRFGGNGKIVVRITGEKAGTWYDFSAEKGGDLFDLVRETKGGDFKDATNYLKNSVGMKGFSNSKANLKLVHDHSNSNFTAEYIKNRQLEQQELEKKQLFVTKLYTRSKEVTKATVAHRYLTNQRSIECQLSEDVKTAGIYSKEKNRYLPALIAFAKDKEGNITGGQYILLKASGTKANVDIPRKSFGKISGSFVDLGSNGDKNKEKSIKPEITIIAEGLETALSVAQALREHSAKTEKTLCSLGISNIKNYQPKLGEKIIIAADNDGANSVTNKTIENAKIALQEKGAYVEIVRPEKEGDFNDVLKLAGTKAIAQSFKPAIDRHNTKTLDEYIVNNDQNLNSELTKEDKLNLAHIEKYDLSQEKILNAWRVNIDKGKNELSSLYSKILSAEKAVDENQAMFDLAKNYNIEVDKKKLVVELMNSEKDSESKSLKVSGEKECITHILTGFNKQKTNSEKIGQVFTIIKKE
ncbi:MAG: AAA family ATPase, partial [Rickettsiaceae bacterium]